MMDRIDHRLQVRHEAERRVKRLRGVYGRAHAPVVREADAYLHGIEAAQAAEGRMALSVDEVAQALGISRDATYQAIRSGEIPSKKVGGRILVPVSRLREWLEDCR